MNNEKTRVSAWRSADKWLTPIKAKWATPSCASPTCIVSGMVTWNVWLGGLAVRSGAYGPAKRMVPIVSDGAKQGWAAHDWRPMATDTSCVLDRSDWISYITSCSLTRSLDAKLTGRLITTAILEPIATDVPSAGEPMFTRCATAVLIRKVMNAIMLKSIIVCSMGTNGKASKLELRLGHLYTSP